MVKKQEENSGGPIQCKTQFRKLTRKLTNGAIGSSKRRYVATARAASRTKSLCVRFEKTYAAPTLKPRMMMLYCVSSPVATGWSQVSKSSTIGQDSQTSRIPNT